MKIVYRNRKSYRGGCEYENWQNICGFAPRMCVCKVFCGIKIMVLIKSLLGVIHGTVLGCVVPKNCIPAKQYILWVYELWINNINKFPRFGVLRGMREGFEMNGNRKFWPRDSNVDFVKPIPEVAKRSRKI